MAGTIIVGLTGSIGMGKSETARMFRRLRIPVFDADAAVHRLMARGGAAVSAVESAFPGIIENGAVNRQALGTRVLGDKTALARLEAILHPRVREQEGAFLRRARAARKPLAVLDIPLLFETGAEGRCDYIIVVSAPAFIQRARVLRRPGMTQDKFHSILEKQVPDAVKRRKADFIVQTGLGKRFAYNQVRDIVRRLTRRQGHKPDKRYGKAT